MSIDIATRGHSHDGWEPSESFWRHRPVAVTGATGFLGSHLVGMLVDLGASVAILSRDQVPAGPISERWRHRVSTVRGDVEDQAVVERLLGDYEVQTVFHLAAQTRPAIASRNPRPTFEANIRGTWSLLEAVRHTSSVGQVVVASSAKAYGAQPSLPYTEETALHAWDPYGASKACADLLTVSYARSSAVPAAITRCANLFGPGDTHWDGLVPGTVRALLEGRPPVIHFDGGLIRDYLYVVDAAGAHLQLAEALGERLDLVGEAFNFSPERPLTVLELVEVLQIAAGTHLEPDWQTPASSLIEHQYLSATKARHVLDWAPGHTVEEAFILTVRWYRQLLDAGEERESSR